MSKRLALNKRLGELGHLNGRHNTRRHSDRLERVHHRKTVYDRSEHTHRIARHAVNALAGSRKTAEDISAA